MFPSDPQSVDPGGGRSLGRGGREKKGVHVFWLFIGEESWKGERRFPLQLGFKGLLPRTKLKWTVFISLPYMLASVIAAAVLFLLHLFGVYLYGCKFRGGVLYVCASFCYGFEGLTGSQHV